MASHDVQRHRTSKRELDELRAVIQRDLADAQIAGLSADRRFATAYNAALQTATMAIACAGYRVTAKAGNHRVTIDAIALTVGDRGKRYADYFETCRRRRNVIDYTRAHVATDSARTQSTSPMPAAPIGAGLRRPRPGDQPSIGAT